MRTSRQTTNVAEHTAARAPKGGQSPVKNLLVASLSGAALPVVLGLTLVAASVFKLAALWRFGWVVAADGWLATVSYAAVPVELWLGTVLIITPQWRTLQRLAALWWWLLGAAALTMAGLGRDTCGCFGPFVQIHPLLVSMFDFTVGTLLFVRATRSGSDATTTTSVTLGTGIATCLATVSAVSVALAARSVHEVYSGVLVTRSGSVLVDPYQWLGQPVPRMLHAVTENQHRKNSMLLLDPTCSECRRSVKHLRPLLFAPPGEDNPPTVVLLSADQDLQSLLQASGWQVVALPTPAKSVRQTPLLIRVHKDIVVEVRHLSPRPDSTAVGKRGYGAGVRNGTLPQHRTAAKQKTTSSAGRTAQGRRPRALVVAPSVVDRASVTGLAVGSRQPTAGSWGRSRQFDVGDARGD